MSNPDWESIESLLNELIQMQHKRVLNCGRQIVPNLTTDDLLQPNDYDELENHPVFRFEEGVLMGIQTAQTALRAMQKDASRN